MEEVWNLWNTKQPPICSVKMVLHHKEINKLKEVLFDALRSLKNSEYLHKEAAFLSRFLYKYKRVFRHDKGMHNLVKINQCLKRYLKLNLEGVLKDYKQTLPSKLEPGASHAYLPTKQMLKWLLIRIQAFSQLFVRIIELCKSSGAYFYSKLLLGWSFNYGVFIFGMIARILTSARFLTAKSIEWYHTLYKYLPYFKETAEYLPEYNFPVDLKKWLGDVDLLPPRKKSTIDAVFELIDLVKNEEDVDGDDDDDDDDVHIKIVKEMFLNPFFKTKVNEESKVQYNNSDIEEIILDEPKQITVTPNRATSHAEDLGVPLGEDDDIVEIPVKKYKGNQGQQQLNWQQRKQKKNKKKFKGKGQQFRVVY